MTCRCLLVTNNSKFVPRVSSIEMLKTSLDVLVRSRDLVHQGNRLLTHPLCGNLRPYQQPFRSVLIEMNPQADPAKVDPWSLELIENALSVYRSCQDRLLEPGFLSRQAEDDCALLDLELMNKSLEEHHMFAQDHSDRS